MNVKHLSTGLYVIVWLALMALTLLSYLLSLADLGAADVAASLIIAGVKTALVLLFFMHLIEQRITNSFYIIVALLFIALLLSLMVSDVVTRHTYPPAPVPAAPLR